MSGSAAELADLSSDPSESRDNVAFKVVRAVELDEGRAATTCR
jgi:hypothetical protein